MSKQAVKLATAAFLALSILIAVGQEAQNQHNQQVRAENAITMEQARELGWAEPNE